MDKDSLKGIIAILGILLMLVILNNFNGVEGDYRGDYGGSDYLD